MRHPIIHILLLCANLCVSAAETRSASVDDAYQRQLDAVKKKAPAGFTVLMEKPFVVVGNDEPAQVRRFADGTVRWAVQKLKAAYFQKDPDEVITIWLFNDKASYERYTRELFDDRPDTPYGYYSQKHRALIMNIATGGGTLVHEIVHPFMHTNFPACPAWFNEGMGSLYEQSAERQGRIVGLTNWRLAGLQKAIRDGKVPDFKKLTGTSDGEFYNDDRGSNYAQARYLCMYMQENGLLQKFYREFVAGQKDDPTGYQTIMRVLGEKDMGAFKKTWEKWVMELRFP